MNHLSKYKFIYIILALLILGVVSYFVFFKSSSFSTKEKQLRDSSNNPRIQLSPEEIRIKENQLKVSNPTVKLTEEEIRIKKLQLAQ